jgi:DNA-binding NtrC family response regulator
MTTSALSITGEHSEVFSKQAPAQEKKILLIDDQFDTSLFIALQQEGYEVIVVRSPQSAWSLVWTLRPHFIIIHLTNLSRGDISSLQGCGILTGGVPIIIAAPVSGSRAIIKGLEHFAPVFLSFPLGPNGIGKILHDLGMSDRAIDSSVSHIGRAVAW